MKLPSAYQPDQHEADIYSLWEKGGAFTPKNDSDKGYFSQVAPPPNANANLHIGYGLVVAIEDVLARYYRMAGKSTLFVPGADHAGFETQAVFEKHLAKEGKSRFDFSREELYAQIWDFVQANKDNFGSQLRSLGASYDWGYFTFTLDKKVVAQAYKTFKKMWDEKLIYRGERLVNYCTFHRTGFADIEVVHEDAVTPLYYIKYGPFTLATTRPETKFGDTAVAVHPGDERYKQWVGKTVTVEGVNGPFEVRVVADKAVDPDFGTGAVKVTPAHSFDDWEIAQRHNLPAVRVINHDGTMNHLAGRFEGLTVLQAREAVAKAMQEQGLIDHVDENYKTRIAKCYKCGTIIEPMLMEQWFIDMQPLAAKAIAALETKEITFYPDSKRTQLITYLKGLKDWNLSRQIAWGIPIPAFQNVDDSDDWIFDERVDQEFIEVGGHKYHRDPDVFDTWFSSSSWPYVTLNYPNGEAFKKFYPLSVMETGGEILYPWVSRMIMLGLYETGQVPFKNVYIHGYVMAEDGSKMSKSLGNVVDPAVIIKKYGSDALRLSLLAGRVPGINRGYDSRKAEEARNFCNKLWNISRFVQDKVGTDTSTPEPASAADHWILNKLSISTKAITESIEKYRLAEAHDILYHFIWDDFADWYVEASKAGENPGILKYVLQQSLKLAHPFAPFVTETLWQNLGWDDGLLAVAEWPTGILAYDNAQAKDFEALKNLVLDIRRVQAILNTRKSVLLIESDQKELIEKLAGVKVEAASKQTGVKVGGATLEGWLEVDKSAYTSKLAEQKTAILASIRRLQDRLDNKAYVAGAPAELVEQTKQELAATKAELKDLEAQL